MDLEEELFHQLLAQDVEENPVIEADGAVSDDLGIGEAIKLSSRSVKRAKIDDQRIFDKHKGLPYIIRNHPKLLRTLKKSEKSKKALLAAHKAQMKHDTEFENLGAVLNFYQLWCHGLFPKANFRDCIKLVRQYGAHQSRVSQLNIYRRELLDREIEKLKVKKGIITEGRPTGEDDDDLYQEQTATHAEAAAADAMADAQAINDNDDWSFMNVNRASTNGLFVGDGDEEEPQNAPQTQEIAALTQNVPSSSTVISQNASDDDDFGDSEDEAFAQLSAPGPAAEEYPEADDVDEYDAELDVMREMGM